MSLTTVNATAKTDNELRKVSVAYDFGDDLADAGMKFGEDVVFNIYKQQAVIKLQAVIRNAAEAGKTDEEIAEAAAEWKPGLVVKADPVAAILKKVKSPEQLAEIIAKLQAKIQG